MTKKIAVYSEDSKLIETYNMGGTPMTRPINIHFHCVGYSLISACDDNKFYVTDPASNPIVTMDTNGGHAICTNNKKGIVYLSEYRKKWISIYTF